MPDNKKDLKDHGVYLFFGDVDDESSEECIEFILEANLNKVHQKLTLIVNSPGGWCCSGFALIDIIGGSKIPIHTIGVGVLASMGLAIFIAGKKGNRILTPNTSIMCHQWYGGAEGKEHELFAAVKGHILARDRMMAHYKKHTGLKEEDIKKHLLPPHDAWLSAKEAKKLRLCDIIKEV